ncbi:hypothetical protein [Aurantiacibacter suaedae]|uniref:hypothetical protein n=1 Tax=Aurantiacibacter suaedae TaxID=2545755 RepID=UPI0010F660FA|nr:hypothetical protein [Aurantiacibacter suaedae]
MGQVLISKANGNDRESGQASSLEFDGSDPAGAIGLAIRTFGPGEFCLSADNGRNWRVHVAADHSWWLEPFGHL